MAPARRRRRHHGPPPAPNPEPGKPQIEERMSYIEPVYWRCSKTECNPDGTQGWLREIQGLSSVGLEGVGRDNRLGNTACYISPHYQTRLSFTNFSHGNPRQWYEIHVPHGGDAHYYALPSRGQCLIFPEKASTKDACKCRQDHTSILYKHDKTPLGLLGGLSFDVQRLTPTRWSCCQHLGSQTPMPLATAHGGCNRCPPGIARQPCNRCLLVNIYHEPLVYFDESRYVAPRWLGRAGYHNLMLPHEVPAFYPDYSPLTAHMMHRAGLEETMQYDSTINRISRLLPDKTKDDLPRLRTRTIADTTRALAQTISTCRSDVWGPGREKHWHGLEGPRG
ncbi:hypothetical protein F5144DRAFT_207761 [Chaetomium tenue]|uniref:Uncharacterized protein n=1 Tax=Chaetomium tenue TaxID=1854479 RepID=A0ACB7PFU9_9PEZI|nr:hypothetical protein F5144DRAFT_207761 [Chaetomium globosum]